MARWTEIWHSLKQMRFTIIFGLLIGVFMAPWGTAWFNYAASEYDEQHPVVKIKADIQEKKNSHVILQMTGDKYRSCLFIRMQAFTAQGSSPLKDAYKARIDYPEGDITKPVGPINYGLWKIWPIDGADRVIVYVQHDCGGRVVQTKIADERL